MSNVLQVTGIQGASPLVSLPYIYLPKTIVIDWMHPVLLGVVKMVLALWLDASYKGRSFYIGDKVCYLCFKFGEIIIDVDLVQS